MDPDPDPEQDPDPDPYLWLVDPDPDPRGPKTCGSGGSGSGFGSGSATLLLNKKDVYQHRIPKNLLLTHLFLLETRSRTRTRFVASNSWLKDWPRKRWIFYAVTNSVRNLDPADQQKPNVMCSQLRDSPHPPPPTPRFPSDLKSVHFFWLRFQTRIKIQFWIHGLMTKNSQKKSSQTLSAFWTRIRIWTRILYAI
jgi:hypothetical protein